ncbi:MAG: hypothetical protein ACP5GI_05570 [Sulfolobales archaeon]
MRVGRPNFSVKRLNMLKKWREDVTIVAMAAKNLLDNELEAVYVVGGVAEGRITVFNDIDIDIVLVVKDPGIKNTLIL